MATLEERREEHAARTRYLRPVEPISYSAAEMLTGIFSVLCPSNVSSITQLHGERKGVVRLTFTSRDAANDLDAKVATRKLNINGVLAAEVKYIGHFVKVVLLDVPDYLSSSDLEAELLTFGPVAYIKRDFHNFEGYHLDSEVRQVLYSWLDRELPGKISVDGHEIFVTSKYSPQIRTRAEKENVQAVGKGYGGHGKSVRSRSASPIRCVSNETAMIVTEKPPSIPTSMTLPLTVPSRRSYISPANVITPEEEDKIIYMKKQTLDGEPKVQILQSQHQENKMADLNHYVEIIDSPHGTLPRKIYHKVSEVVETPVEEVQRNLSPYMERHQLRLQSQSNATTEKDPDVGHRKQDIVVTSRVGWKVGENLASPAVTRRRDSMRDGHSLGGEHSMKTP